MKGYVVIDTEILDAEAFAEYVEKSTAVITAQGGRFLVRTSDAEAFDGGWEPKRIVIIEFESMEAARSCVSSAEYNALNDLRHSAANSRIIVVEGAAS